MLCKIHMNHTHTQQILRIILIYVADSLICVTKKYTQRLVAAVLPFRKSVRTLKEDCTMTSFFKLENSTHKIVFGGGWGAPFVFNDFGLLIYIFMKQELFIPIWLQKMVPIKSCRITAYMFAVVFNCSSNFGLPAILGYIYY